MTCWPSCHCFAKRQQNGRSRIEWIRASNSGHRRTSCSKGFAFFNSSCHCSCTPGLHLIILFRKVASNITDLELSDMFSDIQRSKSMSSLTGATATRAQALLQGPDSDDEKENGEERGRKVQSGRRAGANSVAYGKDDGLNRADKRSLAVATDEAILLRKQAKEREDFLAGVQRNYQTLVQLWKT